MNTATATKTELAAAVNRAGWEPAQIRADIAGLGANPLFAELSSDVLDKCRASAEADAARIEAEGAAAEAEIARRGRHSTPTHRLPYVR